MFQRIASLLFGEDTDSTLVEPKPFLSETEDDGWLIIDLPDSYASTSSEGQRVDERGPSCRSRLARGSPTSTGSSPCSFHDCGGRSMSPLPDPCLMDESWFVTPPPCFTAEGPGPVTVESSPLEDLLIEHPSMSVYVTSSILMEGESPTEQSTDGAVTQTIVERRAPHHPTSITAKATILEKVNHVCRIQRAKELVERRKLSRKSIQRQNYTRERRPRWAKQNGPFVYQPCNRQYNY
ncbi:tumor protein p53-inducible nuclear protein 2 isoform X1 [Microcaecilia unicolor]|uniref:Tumor protein p53-inducible nuclear protein 2 isoform X1 n=1 Tax=Microcaecilia unicolor TaxID=1415580 RepID=A0A6P7YML6_9AMPH|nr:tumor protein p53-inducible nuclear protein 2 isoform X1 [Microcaecilia unicolor]XP_030068588.1 tumor protein p53-inducible nuclear protein 2 isoform X1 [Microcaecilia unicolor]XP_030068589.1 tumor protein p53-inducible nuclear protein 2 isoform X1 [Microcaecilia unicolor]